MDEAEKIYKAVFKTQIPPPIKERFLRASKKLSAGFTQEEMDEYRYVMLKISDLEALELAARRKNRLPLLVSRFRLMVYLAETMPENRKFFLGLKSRRLIWPWCIKFSGLRTVIKLIKGSFLLRALKNV